MTRTATFVFLAGAMVLGLAASATAAPITPTYDAFGPFAATFGGSGIPNHAVATTSFSDSGHTFTIGLTAHQRFVGPNLDNDGAGTFYAPAGESPSGSGLALWNFAYYIDITGAGSLADYTVELLYDFDPGVGTDDAQHGVVDISTLLGALTYPVQDSQNLGFAFLDTSSPPVITPPTYPSFNPLVNGEYTFAIRVSNSAGQLGETAIEVNSVPEPGSMILFGLGAVGAIAGVRRRKSL
jgi:hypothetical protein